MEPLTQTPSTWQRLLTLEPALVRAAAGFLVLLTTSVGLNLGGVIDTAVLVVLALLSLWPLIQGWWTRSAVYAAGVVVAVQEADGQIAAGPASTETDGDLVYVHPIEAHDPSKVDNVEPYPFEV